MHADELPLRERLARALGDAYELGDLLGRGGFAEVYRAQDVSLKRPVAIKTLRFDLQPTATLLTRFRREAEAMARLRHPNIVPVYAVGEQAGLAWFVMPLIEGTSLGDVLHRGTRLEAAEVRRILREVADALDHAHGHGVVHRDIKPDNILLEGGDRRVLVTDFGIAKALEADDGGLTGTGMIVGTPHYMSPEQAGGEVVIDHRSDLYSLGVVGFQLWTGRLPFDAPSVQGIIVKHLTEPVPSVAEGRAGCPRDLDAVISRCLAKEPASRWGSARELSDALQGRGTQGVARAVAGAPPFLKFLELHTRATPRAYRRLLLLYGGLGVAAAALDLALDGVVDFFPIVWGVEAVVLASLYGRLWMAGSSWTDVLRARAGAGVGPTVEESTRRASLSGSFGDYAHVVQEARADRAVIVGHLARMPRSVTERMGDLGPVTDGLLSRVRALAQQLHRLSRTLERGDAGRRSGAVERELVVRRAETEEELTGARASLGELRDLVERVTAEGVDGLQQQLRGAVESARERLR